MAKRFFLPQGGGKIVNTDSMGGWTGIPCGAAYSASKGGLLNLTRSLATEWAKSNIQVNCICPGYVESELIGSAMANEQWMRLVQIRTPMSRLGRAEEVVGAADVYIFKNKIKEPVNVDFSTFTGSFPEATPRFELGNKGFADLCLTTWLCRRIY